jgi:hypothetical protein
MDRDNNVAETTQGLKFGLADKECHCGIAWNVCMSAVYESPNLAYGTRIMGENL